MQFSLRRLLGCMALGCVTLGAAITFAPQKLHPPDLVKSVVILVKSVVIVILVVETAAAAYAACDPWLGCPAKLDADRSPATAHRSRTGTITQTLGGHAGQPRQSRS